MSFDRKANMVLDNSTSHSSCILIGQQEVVKKMSKSCHKQIRQKLCSSGNGRTGSTVMTMIMMAMMAIMMAMMAIMMAMMAIMMAMMVIMMAMMAIMMAMMAIMAIMMATMAIMMAMMAIMAIMMAMMAIMMAMMAIVMAMMAMITMINNVIYLYKRHDLCTAMKNFGMIVLSLFFGLRNKISHSIT